MVPWLPLLVATALGACLAAPPPARPAGAPAPPEPAAGMGRKLPPQRFAQPSPSPPSPTARRARLQQAVPRLGELLGGAVTSRSFPGLAAGVVLDHELVWSAGFGKSDLEADLPVTPGALFRIASITKTFVGVALLAERDRHGLRWDDPVVRFVPEAAGIVYPTRDSPPITLRHLVTHTAGIPRIDTLDYATSVGRGPTEHELLALLRGLALERAPGTAVRYSNLGATLAAIALGRLRRQPPTEAIRELVLRPLGMTQTVWDPREAPQCRLAVGYQQRVDGSYRRSTPWPAGAAAPVVGLYSNVEDMARYVSWQLSAWPPGGGIEPGIATPASLRESQLVLGPAVPEQQAYGVFWMIDADPTLGHVVHHSGSTALYSATVWMLPRRGLGVILLANTGNVASQRLDELARDVLLELLHVYPEPALQLSPPLGAAVDTVKALLLEPERETIRRRFAARFLQSVPAEELAAFFDRHRRTLGLCREHQVLRADTDDAAVVRLYCTGGEMRVSVQVQRAAPHAIVGLVLEAFPQQDGAAPL